MTIYDIAWWLNEIAQPVAVAVRSRLLHLESLEGQMKGLIDIHIPIKPPTDADEATRRLTAYGRRRRYATHQGDRFTPDSIADQGLDGMYAGRASSFPLGVSSVSGLHYSAEARNCQRKVAKHGRATRAPRWFSRMATAS